MCYTEKCCYFVPLNTGCFILGVSNFVISLSVVIISSTYYLEEEHLVKAEEQPHLVANLLNLDVKIRTVNIILGIIATVSIAWAIFSVLLIVGALKQRPSFLLSFFSFGIVLTILGQISGLLLLLKQCWLLSAFIFVPSLLNIHYLVVVHTSYELMQTGKDSGFHRHHDEDEDPLTDSLNESITVTCN